jgi:hypothetical protein
MFNKLRKREKKGKPKKTRKNQRKPQTRKRKWKNPTKSFWNVLKPEEPK